MRRRWAARRRRRTNSKASIELRKSAERFAAWRRAERAALRRFCAFAGATPVAAPSCSCAAQEGWVAGLTLPAGASVCCCSGCDLKALRRRAVARTFLSGSAARSLSSSKSRRAAKTALSSTDHSRRAARRYEAIQTSCNNPSKFGRVSHVPVSRLPVLSSALVVSVLTLLSYRDGWRRAVGRGNGHGLGGPSRRAARRFQIRQETSDPPRRGSRGCPPVTQAIP